MVEIGWHALLPKNLLQMAYKAGEELAWPRQQALAVVDTLSAAGCPIHGIEIWLPTSPGPTIPVPYIYTWHAGDTATVNQPRTAREYIYAFAWDEKDVAHMEREPYFNITAEKLK